MIPKSFHRRLGAGSQIVLIIFALIGIVAVVACVVCGGCTVAMLSLGGFSVRFPEEIKRQVQGLPDVQREIGEIETMEGNFFGSIEGDNRFDSKDIWQFDVEGTKGSGKIFIESPDSDDEFRFSRRILETSNGEFDLGPTPEDYQPIYDNISGNDAND